MARGVSECVVAARKIGRTVFAKLFMGKVQTNAPMTTSRLDRAAAARVSLELLEVYDGVADDSTRAAVP